jgi:hypothetical protein
MDANTIQKIAEETTKHMAGFVAHSWEEQGCAA